MVRIMLLLSQELMYSPQLLITMKSIFVYPEIEKDLRSKSTLKQQKTAETN